MEITSVSNIIGWVYNSLVSENKTTFKYDKGNDVTIVERRSQTVQLYDSSGAIQEYPTKGRQVDIRE